MFSGIRSLIFGAYEEDDSGLNTVQPTVKAAQLLPSLEDQQREEEERLLRESQSVHDDATHTIQDSINFAEDTWELINFDEDEPSQKKTISDEKGSDQPMVSNNSGEIIENVDLEIVKEVSEIVVVAQQVDNDQTLIVTGKGKKKKDRGQSLNLKQVGKLSSLATTTTTTSTNNTTTTTITEPTPDEFSINGNVSKSFDLKQVVKSNVIPVYIRPTISFAAMAAKNSPPAVACGTSLKQSTSCAVPLMKSNELASTVSTNEKISSGAGLKRQRPMSTSSWSSQSDFNDPIIVDSDDESIVSSDFSDCDYDHGFNHDQLMKDSKPKQSNKHKVHRDYAVSKMSGGEKSSSSDNCTKDGLQEHVNQKQNSSKSKVKNHGKSTHGRLIKSKKKKSINEFVFPNNMSALDTVQEPGSTKMKNNENNLKIQVSKTQQCMGPPPPPPPPTTNNSSGNDSSDAAEMDESWFVTPPSCFDGCKSPKKVLRKNVQVELVRTSGVVDSDSNYQQSCRSSLSTIGIRKNLSPENTDLNHRSSSSTELENLLIEHPSMYIARSSKENHQQTFTNQKVESQVKTNHVVTRTPSINTDNQKKESKPLRDEETKENIIATRAAARVLPAVQLLDEHLPYWQKKKKRSQRRSQVNGQKTVSKSCSPCSGKASSCSSASEYSDCSVPSLISSSSAGIINRIGSTIVANITNLTTSLPNVQNVRGIAEEMRKFAENVDDGTQRYPNEQSLTFQRKLAKSIMAKQNKRLASDTGNRRVGRKTKMFTRANGYSIDRKVQKNFH